MRSCVVVVLRYFAVLLLLACASCAPTTPSPPVLKLDPGRYVLVATPSAVCTAGTMPTTIGTFVLVNREGSDWVARAESPDDGSVEFRFHEVLNTQIAGVAVEGRVRGVGLDRRAFAVPGMRVTFAGANADANLGALASAQSTSQKNWIAGNVQGSVATSDGATVRECPIAEIGLRPPAPCELSAGSGCQ